jgi:hypothetical protein
LIEFEGLKQKFLFIYEDYKREGIMSSEDWPSQGSGWIEKNKF